MTLKAKNQQLLYKTLPYTGSLIQFAHYPINHYIYSQILAYYPEMTIHC